MRPHLARAMTDLAHDVRAALRAYPDFPKPGILFQDIGPILANAPLFARTVDAMAAPHIGPDSTPIDAVVGIEARGFLFGAALAERLHAAFVPARKAGKLPGHVHSESYDLEYGKATLELQHDALHPSQRVLIVDDVLATGGTAAATARLVAQTGATLAGYAFVLEIDGLGGRDRLGESAGVITRA